MAKNIQLQNTAGNEDLFPATKASIVSMTDGTSVEEEFEKVIKSEDYNGGVDLNIEPNIVKKVNDIGAELETLKSNGFKSNELPKVFFDGDITGMSKNDAKTLKITYKSNALNFEKYVKMKWQGTSSTQYPKKNFTINIYNEEELTNKYKVDINGWGKQNKFCLKANYIDHSHARNIVSARIWGDIVKSREDYETLPLELRESPNHGAIDGTPFKLYLNGVYQGLYTWNIPKDKWLFAMNEKNPNHEALCGENYVSGCFRAEAIINESDWSPIIQDEVNENIKTSFNNAIRFVMNSNDEEFKNNLSNYFDINSLIDYYIYALASCGLDSMGKNQIYMTYDGLHWFASMYDMDSTWGIYYNGQHFVAPTYKCQDDYETGVNGTSNLLYLRLSQIFRREILERYYSLKENVLSVNNLIANFEDFTDLISRDLYTEDGEIYTGIPSLSTNNIKQIRQFIYNRQDYIMEEIYLKFGSIYVDESILIVGDEREIETTGDVIIISIVSDNENIIRIVDNTKIESVSLGSSLITITYQVLEKIFTKSVRISTINDETDLYICHYKATNTNEDKTELINLARTDVGNMVLNNIDENNFIGEKLYFNGENQYGENKNLLLFSVNGQNLFDEFEIQFTFKPYFNNELVNRAFFTTMKEVNPYPGVLIAKNENLKHCKCTMFNSQTGAVVTFSPDLSKNKLVFTYKDGIRKVFLNGDFISSIAQPLPLENDMWVMLSAQYFHTTETYDRFGEMDFYELKILKKVITE